MAVRSSVKRRRSISTIFSCASRILASYSFKFRGGEALGAYQSLFTLVVLRNEVQIRFRNFQIVAEDGIEFYFERADSGASTLALLDLGEDLLAVAGEFAQVIEIAIQAGGDYATVGEA